MEYDEKNTHTEFRRYCKTLELKNDPELVEKRKEKRVMSEE
jgi:hypothetical protein